MSDSILREVQRQRDRVPLPKTVTELYNGNVLRSEYIDHRPAERALRRFHRRAASKVELAVEDVGIQQAARTPLMANQLAHRFPWAVMWLKRDDEGELKRYKKLCTNLWEAVWLRTRIQEAGVKNATVVSRSRAYLIPVELIGKLPRPWAWCPHCMKPRKYRRVGDETIFALKKVRVIDRRGNVKYEYRERRVALLRCPMCDCTNRSQAWRQSNQPFHTRKFKRGVTRAKRVVKRPKGKSRPSKRR